MTHSTLHHYTFPPTLADLIDIVDYGKVYLWSVAPVQRTVYEGCDARV